MSFEIISLDLKRILADIRPHDFGPIFFWVMWLTILLSSLKGVDRRDELAQVTYMAVVSAFGVLFILVFPIGRANLYSPQSRIILFLILVLVPSIRWLMKKKRTLYDVKFSKNFSK